MAERTARRRRGVGAYLLLLIRIAVGAAAIAIGVRHATAHDVLVADLERWNLPAPDILSWVATGVELVAGLLVLLGLATRLGALLLAITMLVALATGGRSDTGSLLAVSAGMAAASLLLAILGGGAAQLLDRLDPR